MEVGGVRGQGAVGGPLVRGARRWRRLIRHCYRSDVPTPQKKGSDTSEGKILGGAEYNHIKQDEYGPLKSDHSALCPAGLTHAEREEQCVSVQEHTWGTDGLAKLEAIKAKVDPQGLFQCQKCVGFKGPVRDQ